MGALIDSVSVWAQSIGAILGIIAICYGFFRYIDKRLELSRIEDVRPVIRSEIAAALAPIKMELRPNGGSSLRDAVDDARKLAKAANDMAQDSARQVAETLAEQNEVLARLDEAHRDKYED